MPFGRKEDLKSAIDIATNNNIKLSAIEILPKDFKDFFEGLSSQRNAKNGNGKNTDTNMDYKEILDLLEKACNMVKLANGKVLNVRNSEGGSKLEGLDKTVFFGFLVNDILILEAIGQTNNATFMGYIPDMERKMNVIEDEKSESEPDDEKTKASIEIIMDFFKNKSRIDVVKSKLLRRIYHSKINGKYNQNHLVDIIYYADKNPKEFWTTLDELFKNDANTTTLGEKNYVKKTNVDEEMERKGLKSDAQTVLQQISQHMPNTVADVISNVGKQVAERGITSKEAIEYSDKITEKKIARTVDNDVIDK